MAATTAFYIGSRLCDEDICGLGLGIRHYRRKLRRSRRHLEYFIFQMIPPQVLVAAVSTFCGRFCLHFYVYGAGLVHDCSFSFVRKDGQKVHLERLHSELCLPSRRLGKRGTNCTLYIYMLFIGPNGKSYSCCSQCAWQTGGSGGCTAANARLANQSLCAYGPPRSNLDPCMRS